MKFKTMFLLLLFLIIATGTLACTPDSSPTQSSSAAATTATPTEAPKANTDTFKVIKITGTDVLLSRVTEDGSNGGLYTLNIQDIEITRKDGTPAASSDILSGMLLSFGYDTVLEMYPSIIQGAGPIEIIDQKDDIISMYLNAVKDLYEQHTDLNSDITMISLDVTGVKNLTAGDKEALRYLVANEYSIDATLNTRDELVDLGLIDDYLNFETGLLYIISDTDIANDSFTFDISKFRSGLAAYFYTDCTATKTGDVWGYSVGRIGIS
jgi:hypothetical protein